MGLIYIYTTELSNDRNEETFDKRMELLKNNLNDGKNKKEYDQIVHELCVYQNNVQDGLLKQVQESLEINEIIIVNSHEIYQQRRALYEHMREEHKKRAKIQNSRKYKLSTSKEKVDEAYHFYSDKLTDLNQQLID